MTWLARVSSCGEYTTVIQNHMKLSPAHVIFHADVAQRSGCSCSPRPPEHRLEERLSKLRFSALLPVSTEFEAPTGSSRAMEQHCRNRKGQLRGCGVSDLSCKHRYGAESLRDFGSEAVLVLAFCQVWIFRFRLKVVTRVFGNALQE